MSSADGSLPCMIIYFLTKGQRFLNPFLPYPLLIFPSLSNFCMYRIFFSEYLIARSFEPIFFLEFYAISAFFVLSKQHEVSNALSFVIICKIVSCVKKTELN